jgi:hypothetical protein
VAGPRTAPGGKPRHGHGDDRDDHRLDPVEDPADLGAAAELLVADGEQQHCHHGRTDEAEPCGQQAAQAGTGLADGQRYLSGGRARQQIGHAKEIEELLLVQPLEVAHEPLPKERQVRRWPAEPDDPEPCELAENLRGRAGRRSGHPSRR